MNSDLFSQKFQKVPECFKLSISNDDILIELDNHTPETIELDACESPTKAWDILDKKFMNKRLVGERLQTEMMIYKPGGQKWGSGYLRTREPETHVTYWRSDQPAFS